MVDINTAKVLRAKGMTYKDIAMQLGCSPEWCKLNLKNTKKGSVSEYEAAYKAEVLRLVNELFEKVANL